MNGEAVLGWTRNCREWHRHIDRSSTGPKQWPQRAARSLLRGQEGSRRARRFVMAVSGGHAMVDVARACDCGRSVAGCISRAGRRACSARGPPGPESHSSPRKLSITLRFDLIRFTRCRSNRLTWRRRPRDTPRRAADCRLASCPRPGAPRTWSRWPYRFACARRSGAERRRRGRRIDAGRIRADAG